MPRKRKPQLLLINKQKKLIASRLMQISLKVDDYVYKHVPIPVRNAAMFMKEVARYKDKCYEDKRSLQVIEKLIRCMKGIIAEQQELRQGTNVKPDDVEIEKILGSFEDQDLTQFSQDIDVDMISEKPKNDIELIGLYDERTGNNKQFNFNENLIIHLSDDGKDKNHPNEEHSNEHLQRAISNLTISSEDDPLSVTTFTQEHCSQSILNDVDCFINIDNNKMTNTDRIVCSLEVEEVIQPVTTTKKYSNDKVVNVAANRITKKQDSLKLPNVLKIVNNTCDSFKVTATSAENNNFEMNKNNTKSKVQRKRNQKANKKCNTCKGNEQPTKQTSVKKNKQKKEEVLKKTVITTRVNNKYDSEKMYTGQVVKKVKETVPNKRCDSNQEANAEILCNSKNLFIEKPTTSTIYSKEVENDLSWIENIRFVREITLEENIPAYFADSFWENYTLPNDWNNEDFLYN